MNGESCSTKNLGENMFLGSVIGSFEGPEGPEHSEIGMSNNIQ